MGVLLACLRCWRVSKRLPSSPDLFLSMDACRVAVLPWRERERYCACSQPPCIPAYCMYNWISLITYLITRNCAEADVVSITVTHDGVVSSTAYTRCYRVPLFRTASLFATMNNVNTQTFSFLCFVLHIFFFVCVILTERSQRAPHSLPNYYN